MGVDVGDDFVSQNVGVHGPQFDFKRGNEG